MENTITISLQEYNELVELDKAYKSRMAMVICDRHDRGKLISSRTEYYALDQCLKDASNNIMTLENKIRDIEREKEDLREKLRDEAMLSVRKYDIAEMPIMCLIRLRRECRKYFKTLRKTGF